MNSLPLTRLASGQLGVRATLPLTEIEQIDDDLFAIRVSDETLDRYGEVITASGWQLDHYRRNPVVQNCHQYGDITFTIARAVDTYVVNRALCQTWQFASQANPLAKIARDLYRGGFLRAASVGFIPLRWEDGKDSTGPAQGGPGAAGSGFRRRYLAQELIEVSAVAIPANPNALALGVESGAVSIAALKQLVAMLRGVPALHDDPNFCPHPPAGLPANARASGLETDEAHWAQFMRQIVDASQTK